MGSGGPRDFKSVGGYRKVSVLGSIPRRFRHLSGYVVVVRTS